MYKSRDIVAVPFPFTEGNTEKRRPALIVSSSKLGDTHGLYWLVMITSADNEPWEGDVNIKNNAKAGLSFASVVRTAKIATLQEDRIVRKIGEIEDAEYAKVRKSITGFLN